MGKIKVNEIEKHDATEVTVNSDVVMAAGTSVSSPSISTDTISEKTSASGVTIDGVLLKDGAIASSYISGLSGGKVLQVVYAATSSSSSTTSSIYADTGLSASITPTSSSNHILVLVQNNYHLSTGTTSGAGSVKLVRDSTDVWGHDNNSANQIFIRANGASSVTLGGSHNITFRDSPSSTSSITYKTQFKTSAGTLYFTYGGVDTMILMEIAG